MGKEILKKDRFTILDGAMGTMLQKAGLAAGERPEDLLFSAPQTLTEIHRAYIEAGADIVYTNTFGANRKKLAGYSVDAVVKAAVQCARAACEGTGALVALDIGPLGELLEPGGTLSFEEAYGLFEEVVRAGTSADLIVIETMADLLEIKAAVLAARENSDLPILASMSFEADGRSFSGVPIEAMALTLEHLGVAGLGINCSLGPAAIMPLAQRLCQTTALPVFVKPNAGLPDPATGAYTLSDRDFAREMEPCLAMGVQAVGGCCGTSPETIRALKEKFSGQRPASRVIQPQSRLCSATRVLDINRVCPIGERINPTGKKRLQQALRDGDIGYIQTLAVTQQQEGTVILDINAGAPGVDEVAMLPKMVKAVQAVSSLPLSLDSANPDALAAALRVVNGKPLVNSTSGEKEKMDRILPLCKQYGAAIIGLTLDENGIPETAAERFSIAQTIVNRALGTGIPREDIYIDCLTLTASAAKTPPIESLAALRQVKTGLGVKTLLGVSNVSFGLPNRPLINKTFLIMALEAGLDLPIINPAAEGMMEAIAVYELLNGTDKDAANYIARYANTSTETPASQAKITLEAAIEAGLGQEAAAIAKEQLQSMDGLTLVNGQLMPALDRVGDGFEKGTVYLPQLMAAAGAAQAAFEEIRFHYGDKAPPQGEPIVLATVQGDIHDIGKNIVKVLLENYGYRVIDLGRDVPPDAVVEAVRTSKASLVGLSALMTTTLPAMQKTVQALKEYPCRVMVGGAVLTESYAAEIGADFYAKDAKQGVDIAKKVFNK